MFSLLILIQVASCKLPLRWLPTVTVQLNIDQSLRYQNDLAFRFLMLKNSLKIMKTSFVFVNQEIRKQKLHKKCNRVSKSHAFLDFQICACAQWTYVESIFFHVNAGFSWFSHIPFGEFFLNFAQLLTMIMGKTYLNFKEFYK